MTKKQTESIALAWLDAFNQHNLEMLLSLYDNDAVHFSPKLKIHKPETNGFIQGKDALRNWWQDAFNHLPSLHYKVIMLTANNDRIFMEYIRKVNGEEDLRVGEMLEIKKGLIIASRVYHG